jgi:putative ATP-binding cassette transporter
MSSYHSARGRGSTLFELGSRNSVNSLGSRNSVNSRNTGLTEALLSKGIFGEANYSNDDDSFAKKSCCEKMGILRLILQDYFYPYTEKNGWLFTSLFVSLVVSVIHVTCSIFFFATQIFRHYDIKVGVMGPLGEKFLEPFPKVMFYGTPFTCCSILIFIYCWKGVLQNLKQWLILSSMVLWSAIWCFILASIGFMQNDLIGAMSKKPADYEQYRSCLVIFGVTLMAGLPINILGNFILSKWLLNWREYLTTKLFDIYMANRTYYHINAAGNGEEEDASGNISHGNGVDNPDQRLAEDVGSFIEQFVTLVMSYFDNVLNFTMNIAILLNISEVLTIVTVSYALIFSIAMIFTLRKYTILFFNQLRREANFRYSLVHIRDNVESIAFYSGEEQISNEVKRRFQNALKNKDATIKYDAIVRTARKMISYVSMFIPFIILGGTILRGEMTVGDFMQAQFVQGIVYGSLTACIINNVEAIASFNASFSRLAGFYAAITSTNHWGNSHSNFKSGTKDEANLNDDKNEIVLDKITVQTPGKNAKMMSRNLSLRIKKGSRILVAGPSGCGKTSLLRVISGLWMSPTGNISVPNSLMFVSQKPYITLGTLREQLCYPSPKDEFDERHFREIIQEAKLGPSLLKKYGDDWDRKEDWSRILSLGEQQRLAFARIFLHMPKFVVLDEATSALDVATEKHLYKCLAKKGIACVSVGHRVTIVEYHETVLCLDPKGTWKTMPAMEYATVVKQEYPHERDVAHSM